MRCHLSTSRDSPRTPFRHAVALDAEVLGELLPRYPQFCEPLQPLPEVLREDLQVRAPLSVYVRPLSYFLLLWTTMRA